MSENFIQGQFSIEALTLINQYGESVDIRGLTDSFYLFESIYEKFITAQLGIIDGLGLLKNYRFSGQEFIRIAIKQKEGMGEDAPVEYTIDKTFRVYKAGNIVRAEEKVEGFILYLIEPRAFNCIRTRLSRVLRGSYDDMLENVLVNEAKIPTEEFDHWEETVPDNFQFICPNWTAGKVIDYCVNNGDTGLSSDWRNSMFFFQTLNGGFRYQSVGDMFTKEFPLPFSFRPRNSDPNTNEADLNAKGGLNTQILSFNKPQVFDTLTGTVGGAYASMMKTYDPVRKIEEDVIFDMKETFERGQHLSGHPMIHIEDDYEYVFTSENQTDAEQSPPITELDVDLPPNKHFTSLVDYDIQMNHSYDDSSDISTNDVFKGIDNKDNAKLERRALLETLQQNRIEVTIPLRTDLSVGTFIILKLPSNEPTSEQDITDKLNDGRYLITDINIVGEPQKGAGVMNIECVKESYMDKLINVKPLLSTANPEVL